MKSAWQTKRLGEICEIERGGSPRPIQSFLTRDPNGVNWIKISDATASGKYIYATKEKIKSEGVRRSRMVYEGDFLLSNSMSFGRPYIMRTSGCIHDGWLVLRQPKVDSDYLYYVLSSQLVFNQFDRLAAGSTVRNLNIGLAQSVEIPYPPLPEQQRIVAKLDEAFAAIAKAKENAEKNVTNAHAIFESELNAIFTEKGEGWIDRPLGDVCSFENGDRGENYPSRAVQTTSGIPFINAGHLVNGRIDFLNMNYIPRERFNILGNGKIKRNDILFCLRGSLGKFGSVGDLAEGAIASSLVIIRPGTELLHQFLLAYLQSDLCAQMIRKFQNGAAQPNLGGASLKKFTIPAPSLSEQERVTKKLENLREETQQIEVIYQSKISKIDELKKSFLHHAFSGQL